MSHTLERMTARVNPSHVAEFAAWTDELLAGKPTELTTTYADLLVLRDAALVRYDEYHAPGEKTSKPATFVRQMNLVRSTAINRGRVGAHALTQPEDIGLVNFLTYNLVHTTDLLASTAEATSGLAVQFSDDDQRVQQQLIRVIRNLRRSQEPAQYNTLTHQINAAGCIIQANAHVHSVPATVASIMDLDYDSNMRAARTEGTTAEHTNVRYFLLRNLTLTAALNQLGHDLVPAEKIARDIDYLTTTLGQTYRDYPEGRRVFADYRDNFGPIVNDVAHYLRTFAPRLNSSELS